MRMRMKKGGAGSYSQVNAAGCCVRIPERSEMRLKTRLVDETSGKDKRTRVAGATTSTVRCQRTTKAMTTVEERSDQEQLGGGERAGRYTKSE